MLEGKIMPVAHRLKISVTMRIVFIFIMAATCVLLLQGSPAPLQNSPTAFSLPAGQQFTNTGRQLVSIAPDGRQMVYVANTQLNLVRIGERQATVIPGTQTPMGITNP